MRIVLMVLGLAFGLSAAAPFASDTLQTQKGPLIMTFIGHGTLLFDFKGYIIHIDPVGQYADYAQLPPANLILITHEHGDHLDAGAIAKIRRQQTVIIANAAAATAVEGAIALKNGEKKMVGPILVEAVPAYNIVHKRSNGQPFHPKGNGNGYVLNVADKRLYIAGDTENIPEMAQLKKIDVAFLPMNLPYTMTPEMVAKAAKVIRPAILYPYHYGTTDPAALMSLLKDEKDIIVRIRPLR